MPVYEVQAKSFSHMYIYTHKYSYIITHLPYYIYKVNTQDNGYLMGAKEKSTKVNVSYFQCLDFGVEW